MTSPPILLLPYPAVTRRRLVQGAAAAGVLSLVPWPLRTALAEPAPVLSGTEFTLEIGAVPLTINRRPATATGVNGQVPAPILRWREGDTLTLAVTNRLSEPSSIHWHGIRTPSPMDGVPGLSFRGIAPGETFVYRFPVRQNGTYWYHSHSMFQEQTGLYGAIVIQSKGGYAQAFDRTGALSNSRATTTITDSARSAPSLKMPRKKVSPRRSPTASSGARCA
jgi:FtsP/CotA-like multicopper oxidase with cupredoxin domain